jgi:hypothetical protein
MYIYIWLKSFFSFMQHLRNIRCCCYRASKGIHDLETVWQLPASLDAIQVLRIFDIVNIWFIIDNNQICFC